MLDIIFIFALIGTINQKKLVIQSIKNAKPTASKTLIAVRQMIIIFPLLRESSYEEQNGICEFF